MPGIAFGREARLRIAHALDDLGLSEIEIGFAASGREQRDDMRAVVDAGLRAKLLSLARPMAADIEAVRETGVDGVILFIGTSEIHLRQKLRRTEDDVAEIVLGKTTGRTAIRHLAGPAADRLTDADLEWIISEVKSLAESGLCGDANVLKGLVEQCRQRLKA